MSHPRRTSVIVRVAAIVLAVITGLSWALASSVGSSPDDDFHQASIWCPFPAENSGCELQRNASGEVIAVRVPNTVALSAACFAFHQDISGSCTRGIPAGTTLTDRFNRGEYPGGFYRVLHQFAGPDVEGAIVVMRIVNVLLAVALLGSLALVAAPGQRLLLVLAVLAPLVPLGLSLIASVNPSGWAFIGVTAAAAGLLVSADALTGRRLLTASTLAVVGALVAISARGDAGPYLCVTTAAVGLTTFRRERNWLLTRAPAHLVVGLVGVASYLSSRQASLLTDVKASAPEDPFRIFYTNVTELPTLFEGMFGSWALGWTDNPMPAVVSGSSLFIATVVIVLGMNRLTPGKTLGIALVGAVMIAVPLILLQRLGHTVGSWVQPRYILPLAPVFLMLMAYDGRTRNVVPISRIQTVAIASLAAIGNAMALYSSLRRYLTGLDGPVIIGRAVEWWWPFAPSPRVVFVCGALAFSALVLIVTYAPQGWFFRWRGADCPAGDRPRA